MKQKPNHPKIPRKDPKMRRANIIEKDSKQIGTIEDLTSVFESIASTKVAKVRGKVELSKEFFRLLWASYRFVKIDPKTHITNRELNSNPKQVFIIVSAEGGLGGDIDHRLIETMLGDYDKKTTDIIVLGTHGATQLTQRNINFVHFFQVPDTDSYIDVSPVISAVNEYSKIFVYYEEYISLSNQAIKRIDLVATMRGLSEEQEYDNINLAENTIFEPSVDQIAEQMEETMMSLVLSQSILESSLAQAASRFNAMAVAKKRASELLGLYQLEYHRSKRADSDRRLREVMISIKGKKKHAGGGA